jgi:hypothetical protein
MAAWTDVLLANSARHISTIRSIYQRAASGAELTVPLFNAVRYAILDLQSALEWTANALPHAHDNTYFPIVRQEGRFADRFDVAFPGLRDTSPRIFEAVKRHQPYHREKYALRYLPRLASRNKHYEFIKHDRSESHFTAIAIRGGVATATGSFDPLQPKEERIAFGALPDVDGQIVLHESAAGRFSSAVRGKVVDWYFQDPELPQLPVLATIIELHLIVSDAVADIARAAEPDVPHLAVVDIEGEIERPVPARMETFSDPLEEPYTIVLHGGLDGAETVVGVTFDRENGDRLYENGKQVPPGEQRPGQLFGHRGNVRYAIVQQHG